MLLTGYVNYVTKAWSRCNKLWKRIFCFALALSFSTAVSIFLFGDAINEIPDRWHLPFLNPEPPSSLASPADIFTLNSGSTARRHPISHLITDADNAHRLMLQKKTTGVQQAAQAYRARRGRHPPPHFDQWVAFAESHGSLMIEEFFDRIHHDLNPFWAIAPASIRASSVSLPNYIRVRNGTASRSEIERPFMDSYFDLVRTLAKYLPDLDIPINEMDESRVLVPWRAMAEHMQIAQASRKQQHLAIPPQNEEFTTLSGQDVTPAEVTFTAAGPYWNLARAACRPDLEASALEVDEDFSTPPVFPVTYPHGTYSGFVQNWTISQDFCVHPHLRNMHGSFVEPVSISTTSSLVPIFGGSKLLANNDILLPAAMYWADRENFAASKYHVDWRKKRNEVFWRGTGSGGRNKADNWTRFHRHRLVSLLNGTQMEMTLRKNDGKPQPVPHNFPRPDQALYPLVSVKLGRLVDWIRSFSNVAFYWLECFPGTRDFGCAYTGSWYRHGRKVSMDRMYKNKYLPDIDGNSFSGRFRAFMLSNSLPIKATIYTEWHDSRLIPWKHFVPMDNTFVDTLSVLEFLFQYDAEAEKIALEGRRWAEQVLRKEDMLVYTYRLLLEFARVSDPNRESLGFGQDLK